MSDKSNSNDNHPKKPLRKKLMYWIGLPILILVVAYLCLALRYSIQKPVLSHNYSAEYNAAILEIPEEQRAVTFYRKALMMLEPEPIDIDNDFDDGLFDRKSGEKNWDELVAYLKRNQEAIEMFQKASKIQVLGELQSDQIDPQDIPWILKHTFLDEEFVSSGKPASENPVMLSVGSRTFWRQYSLIKRLFQAQIRVAVTQKDTKKIIQSFDVLFRMSEQLLTLPTVIDHLFSYVIILGDSLDQLNEILFQHPNLFSDEELNILFQKLSTFSNGKIKPQLSGERVLNYDIIQRNFTDNGNGDGFFIMDTTADYWEYIGDHSEEGKPLNKITLLERLALPITCFFSPTRAELTTKYDEWMDKFEQSYQVHFWQYQPVDDTEINSLINEHKLYSLFLPTSSSYEGVYFTCERLTQKIDAVRIVLALHRYRLKHDKWPKQLDELKPELIDSIPSDRFTGKPVKYRISDGQPMIYSVGENRVDNGGSPAVDTEDEAAKDEWYEFFYPDMALDQNAAREGDWILWPLPPEE